MKLFIKILFLVPTVFCVLSCGGSNKPVEPQMVTVTLDPDGGSISSTSVMINKGTAYKESLFPIPVKNECKFNKWCFSSGEDIPSDYVINSDISLKANYVIDKDAQYIKHLNIKPVGNTNYLYEATYDDYDYEEGKKYLESYYPSADNAYYRGGNCSSIFKDGFYGRNMDWLHGTTPEFIIHTTAKNERHATLGVAFCAGLNNANVGTTKDMYHHRVAPFITTDGINDVGVCVSINEIDKRDCGGINLGTNTGKQRWNVLGLVRYILDYANSVAHAETLLKELDIYTPSYLFEQHVMIADSTGDSAVIEFNPNGSANDCHKTIKFIRKQQNNGGYFNDISTNFNFLTYDGTDQSLIDYQKHACGVERYNIIKTELASKTLTSLDDTLDFMAKTYYTKSYTNELSDYSDTFWFSEFYYTGTTNIDTPKTKDNFQKYVDHFLPLVSKKVRSDSDYTGYYNTLHSVAYDINKKTMKIVFEEEHKIDKVFSI